MCVFQIQIRVQLVFPESNDSSCSRPAHQHSVHHPKD